VLPFEMAQIGLTGVHARGRISSRSSLTSRDSRVLRRFHPATGMLLNSVVGAQLYPESNRGNAAPQLGNRLEFSRCIQVILFEWWE
jgi:hypothetical protein